MRILSLLLFSMLLLPFASNAQRYKTKIFAASDTTFNITYGSAMNSAGQQQDLVLDFFEPKGDTLGKRPLIIYIHGGGFTSGDKSELHIIGICANMAERGYAVANINYRLDPSFDIYNSTSDRRAMIDAMHDARAAVRFFRRYADQYGIDTSFIAIGGESAGAATSMLVTYVDEQSELSSYPMADPNNIEGNSGNPGYSSEVDYVMCLCGLFLDTTAMNTGDQAMLWVHGTDDSFVPYSLAKTITTRAENVGLEYEDYTFQDGVHCPWYVSLPNWLFYLDTTINYMTDFLYPKVIASAENLLFVGGEVSVIPNPSNGLVSLSLNQPITWYAVYNNLGQEVMRTIDLVATKEHVIDLQEFPDGMYYLETEVGRLKVLVKR